MLTVDVDFEPSPSIHSFPSNESSYMTMLSIVELTVMYVVAHVVMADRHHHHPLSLHHHLHRDSNFDRTAGLTHKSEEYEPIYKRKAVHAHDDGLSCHHFGKLYRQHHESAAQRKACKKENREIHRAVHASYRTGKRDDGGTYTLVKKYAGSTFFDDMSFYTHQDPSGGMIEYVDEQEARRENLIGVRNGHAFMRFGPGDNGNKKSVRITTKDSFTTGIFVLDAVHMPTGCGVWPSFWTTPSNPAGGWPSGGEIDVIEGVHYFSRNMQSIHALSSCHLPQSIKMLGRLADPDVSKQRNCDPRATDDQGCGIQSQQDGDYGRSYNRAGGGVHAMVWDEQEGIKVFFFARGHIPSDIANGHPDPSGWGTPRGSWPSDGCNPAQYFSSHVAVFTNTVCGTWAGSSPVWNNKGSGQDVSCAQKTGKSSCYEYMLSNPDLPTAYWEIKSLSIYQTSRRT